VLKSVVLPRKQDLYAVLFGDELGFQDTGQCVAYWVLRSRTLLKVRLDTLVRIGNYPQDFPHAISINRD
jgi:hypothetical protein